MELFEDSLSENACIRNKINHETYLLLTLVGTTEDIFTIMHEFGHYLFYYYNLEKERFHAYEKNHSTVLSVSQVMENLQVKNLILYHTEESHGASRKELFQEEAKTVFSGNVIVPDDLEEIKILKK